MMVEENGREVKSIAMDDVVCRGWGGGRGGKRAIGEPPQISFFLSSFIFFWLKLIKVLTSPTTKHYL